jgi:predicted short-subunit dehydrogenase-like oxidoreductase (DUF2520 family)
MDITLVGAGRLGTALARALKEKGAGVIGPLRREDPISGEIVLLAVPDREIANAAKNVPPNALVGHTAGAIALDVFGGREAFSMHPLMTAGTGKADFTGASAAVAGTTARARRVARDIATTLEMHPIEVEDAERIAYHTAASIAANFLVTLETMAERVGKRSGLERHHLLPLARAALENWASLGSVALTGPIVRGDELTVTRQRDAIARRAPEFLPLWDCLTSATRQLAADTASSRP